MKSVVKISFFAVFLLTAILSLTVDRAYAYIPCQCKNPPDQCTCFIQLGDKGLPVKLIIERLEDKGYVQKLKKKTEFTPEVREAVIQFQADNGLECTGWMDDDTLNTLLKGALPDKGIQFTVKGWDAICFVPTDGGKKYHDDPNCSGMYYPRMISRVNAACLGIEECQKDSCTRCAPLTYSSLGLTPRSLPDEYYAAEEDTGTKTALQITDAPANVSSERLHVPDDAENLYIGNKNSHVFHRGDCASVKSMSEKNKKLFQTRDEAIGAGFRPCDKCKP